MVANAATTIEAIIAAGGTIVQPVNPDEHEVYAHFRDPAGNVLGIYQQAGLAEIEAQSSCRQPIRERKPCQKNSSYRSSRGGDVLADTNVALESADPRADHAELQGRGVDVDAALMGGDGTVPALFFFRDQARTPS